LRKARNGNSDYLNELEASSIRIFNVGEAFARGFCIKIAIQAAYCYDNPSPMPIEIGNIVSSLPHVVAAPAKQKKNPEHYILVRWINSVVLRIFALLNQHCSESVTALLVS